MLIIAQLCARADIQYGTAGDCHKRIRRIHFRLIAVQRDVREVQLCASAYCEQCALIITAPPHGDAAQADFPGVFQLHVACNEDGAAFTRQLLCLCQCFDGVFRVCARFIIAAALAVQIYCSSVRRRGQPAAALMACLLRAAFRLGAGCRARRRCVFCHCRRRRTHQQGHGQQAAQKLFQFPHAFSLLHRFSAPASPLCETGGFSGNAGEQERGPFPRAAVHSAIWLYLTASLQKSKLFYKNFAHMPFQAAKRRAQTRARLILYCKNTAARGNYSSPPSSSASSAGASFSRAFMERLMRFLS